MNEITCQYEGDSVDCGLVEYIIFEPDVRNFMGYTLADCISTFSIGQGIRIRETIEWNLTDRFSNVETTIPALYEPYVGSYPMYFPHPGPYTQARFQPGFEYKFVECCCDYQQPAEYGDTFFSFDINNVVKHVSPYEVNYASIYHPNHSAISITQVDNANGFAQVQKCYDNYYTPPVIGGSITKFLDEVVNTNITIAPQDSTSINSATLIDDLQQGLYKIEKNYIDGTQQQTLIYKENN